MITLKMGMMADYDDMTGSGLNEAEFFTPVIDDKS
jgi:hypothetical protein